MGDQDGNVFNSDTDTDTAGARTSTAASSTGASEQPVRLVGLTDGGRDFSVPAGTTPSPFIRGSFKKFFDEALKTASGSHVTDDDDSEAEGGQVAARRGRPKKKSVKNTGRRMDNTGKNDI